jgi:predicted dehydrogenase
MLRAAVVGCGYIGSRFNETAGLSDRYSHCAAFSSVEGVVLAAVADSDPARAAEAGAFWGVPHFSDVDTMVASAALQIVGIATHASGRLQLVERLLAQPDLRGLLCEKPLGDSLASAEALASAVAERPDVCVAVNLVRRYDDGHVRAKAMLDAGAMGRVQAVTGFYTKGLRNSGIHMLDLMRWFFGDPVSVTAVPTCFDDDADADQTPDFELRYPNGLRVVIRGCDALAVSLFEIDIVGTEGRIRIEHNGQRISIASAVPHPNYPEYRTFGDWKPLSTGMRDTTRNAVADLVAAIADSREPRVPIREALEAERLVDRIQKSLHVFKPTDPLVQVRCNE